MAALIPSANASGSGTMTLAGPSTNSNQTVTIPDATGTMMVSGNMPAFSATQNASTSLTTSVTTKILFGTEEFDTNNNFSSSRFTPTVTGYYQVSACMGIASVPANITLFVYKNGTEYKSTTNIASAYQIALSCLVYCNGTTDYFEIYAKQNGTTQGTDTTASGTWFQASMVRGA